MNASHDGHEGERCQVIPEGRFWGHMLEAWLAFWPYSKNVTPVKTDGLFVRNVPCPPVCVSGDRCDCDWSENYPQCTLPSPNDCRDWLQR